MLFCYQFSLHFPFFLVLISYPNQTCNTISFIYFLASREHDKYVAMTIEIQPHIRVREFYWSVSATPKINVFTD